MPRVGPRWRAGATFHLPGSKVSGNGAWCPQDRLITGKGPVTAAITARSSAVNTEQEGHYWLAERKQSQVIHRQVFTAAILWLLHQVLEKMFK